MRVLESSSSQACRLAGMLLADLGADVVRTVGSSERDLADPQTLGWDRGKRFAGVGSSAEAARLAESAHVVLDDGTGLYSAAAGTANPRLVRVQLPPYGVVGRESDLPADPLLLSALSGFASVHPSYDPGTPIASVVSVLAGIHGAFGAVAAVAGLIEATETGRGRTLVTTGLDAGAAALSTLVMTGIDVDVVLSPGGRPDSRPSFRVYRCADGEYLHLAALTAEFFLPALDVLGRVDVMVMPGVDGEFMNVNRPEIAATVSPELERTFATRPRDEWVAALTAAGVPCAPVQSRVEWTMSDFVASAAPPVTREHPDLGEVVQPGTPFWFTDATVRPGALPTRSRFLRATDVWRDPAPVPASERGTSEPRRLPLDGLRVLDASTFLAGPTVGALMSDLGASVAKVESPSGDPYAVYAPSYASVNYGKTIGALDQRTPAGRASMVELLTDADVLIDNLRPSVARRLGLDRESVAAVNDRLIKVSVSGYGPDGPHAETPRVRSRPAEPVGYGTGTRRIR
ncbi:CoA transferase [Gordonia humi]|uniref:CoA transferase n=1 Tax=Gordonia humi TaxID=686429 RepID=UPI00361DEB08